MTMFWCTRRKLNKYKIPNIFSFGELSYLRFDQLQNLHLPQSFSGSHYNLTL